MDVGVPSKRSVGRLSTRWMGDIKRVAGSGGGRSGWKLEARDRGFWNSLQKTYVQQWTTIVQMMMMMIF
ncbi:jg19839 [Pararge aegeria aegeria]|uniref:Jg19839 protein n=1 Tax=Pararge aegeria aegeria TaxID=348720 RepID=A0A8S4SI57_9NEOP|nr:jg19839 [Pararge aegeria aegeria]